MSDEEHGVTIYVLPTEQGRPPRAVIGQVVETPIGVGLAGVEVSWSQDVGAWVHPNGDMIQPQVGELITEHAKSLGVEW